jgi:hypothetical protein
MESVQHALMWWRNAASSKQTTKTFWTGPDGDERSWDRGWLYCLNEVGKEGWEVVEQVAYAQTTELLLKRAVE